MEAQERRLSSNPQQIDRLALEIEAPGDVLKAPALGMEQSRTSATKRAGAAGLENVEKRVRDGAEKSAAGFERLVLSHRMLTTRGYGHAL